VTNDDTLLELLPAEIDDAEFTRCCTGSCDSCWTCADWTRFEAR